MNKTVSRDLSPREDVPAPTGTCEFCVHFGADHVPCDPCRIQGARVVTVNAGELP